MSLLWGLRPIFGIFREISASFGVLGLDLSTSRPIWAYFGGSKAGFINVDQPHKPRQTIPGTLQVRLILRGPWTHLRPSYNLHAGRPLGLTNERSDM